MTTLFGDFSKLHPNHTVTEVNGKKLCNEEDYSSHHYYIKIETDKYPDVDWTRHCCYSILQFDLDDALVVDSHYSGEGCTLFD
jgi:hypothetical protein